MGNSIHFIAVAALVLLVFLFGCPQTAEQPPAPQPPVQQQPTQNAPAAQPFRSGQQGTAQCGNQLLEPGEECDSGVGCTADQVCDDYTCKCEAEAVAEPEPAPAVEAACGNEEIEEGEACEVDSDCEGGSTCSGCQCVPEPVEVQPPQDAFCGNGLLDETEECDVGTAGKPSDKSCPSGEYCSSCKCYTAAEPISCYSNHLYYQATGINEFIWTTLPACGDDCAVYGIDYKCDLTTCTCVVKSVTSHTCGNDIKESAEECDGTDESWCNSDQICGNDCTCVSVGGS